MLNLLPEEQKKKVTQEYSKRIWIVLCFGVIAVVAVSATFLIPVYVMAYGTYADFLNQKKELDSRIAASERDTSAESVRDISGAIRILKQYNVATPPTKLIESVVKNRAPGVRIVHISYTPSQNDPVAIDISGRATTRTALVNFSDKLKANPDFSSVSIPISNFAKEKNIDFTAKLIVAPEKAVQAAPKQ